MIRLRRIEDRFEADRFDARDTAREALRMADDVFHSARQLVVLRGQQETDFAHEDVSRLTVDDQLEQVLARLLPDAAASVRHLFFAGVTSMQNATEDAKVGKQDLYVFEKARLDRREP
ncbi:MAG: hypothetical protein ACM3SO_03165, partial [Betaproteobacteria bacterium]